VTVFIRLLLSLSLFETLQFSSALSLVSRTLWILYCWPTSVELQAIDLILLNLYRSVPLLPRLWRHCGLQNIGLHTQWCIYTHTRTHARITAIYIYIYIYIYLAQLNITRTQGTGCMTRTNKWRPYGNENISLLSSHSVFDIDPYPFRYKTR